jgi:hypothetical protein
MGTFMFFHGPAMMAQSGGRGKWTRIDGQQGKSLFSKRFWLQEGIGIYLQVQIHVE